MGIDYLGSIGDLIGKDNTVYTSMIEGINNNMNIDIEEMFNDPYKKEGLITEIIVQNLNNGGYVDISESHRYLENEHWRNIVSRYANENGIK